MGAQADMDTKAPPPLDTPALRARYLGCLAAFSPLPSVLLGELASASQVLHLQGGAKLFARGESTPGFWIVVSGRMVLELPTDCGGARQHEVAGGGAAVGLDSLFGESPSPMECRSIAEATLLFLPGEAVVSAMARCSRFGEALLRELSDRMHGLVAEWVQARQASAEARFASHLCKLAQASPDPSAFRLPERKRQIAGRLAIAPETLSRVLRSLQDAGVIEVDGDRVRIRDMQRLSQMAEAAVAHPTTALPGSSPDRAGAHAFA
jgi:CRP/FNR family transcriptional regulator, dissimilatory nitrate respiration regulator